MILLQNKHLLGKKLAPRVFWTAILTMNVDNICLSCPFQIETGSEPKFVGRVLSRGHIVNELTNNENCSFYSATLWNKGLSIHQENENALM